MNWRLIVRNDFPHLGIAASDGGTAAPPTRESTTSSPTTMRPADLLSHDLRSFHRLIAAIDDLSPPPPFSPFHDPLHQQMRHVVGHLAADLFEAPLLLPSVSGMFWPPSPLLDPWLSPPCPRSRGSGVVIKEISEHDAELINRKNRTTGAGPVPVVTLPDDDSDDEYEYEEVVTDEEEEQGDRGEWMGSAGAQSQSNRSYYGSTHGGSGREILIPIHRPDPRSHDRRASQERNSYSGRNWDEGKDRAGGGTGRHATRM